jgi:hexulose-6-phosphate isomerase
MKRRQFLRYASAVPFGAAAKPSFQETTADSQVKKAVKLHMLEQEASVVEKFRLLKKWGFEGVEVLSPSEYPPEAYQEAQEKTGLTIHGVVAGWKSLGSANAKRRAEGRQALETALNEAAQYGATTVLVVPATVTEKVPYQQAYWRSQTELRKVLPTAERLEVRLAVENVWNRFLWSPLEFAQYLDEFYSPWIGAYLDLGNTLTYGWPQQWIRILGSRIVKLDLKDRSRAQYDERGQAIRTKLGKGDANWAAILAALDEIGYTGWGTAEVAGGGPERMVEISQNMDQILSG